MATAIAGGVLGCSILALYLVPAAYVSIRRRSLRRDASGATRTRPALPRLRGRASAVPAPSTR